jgi:hypothetical protein
MCDRHCCHWTSVEARKSDPRPVEQVINEKREWSLTQDHPRLN